MNESFDPATWAVLAIDLGTGGPKMAFVTLDGQIHWSEFRPVETEHPAEGRALQDPQTWWDEIIDATSAALDAAVIPREWIRAISITGQWSSTVPVRADLTPAGSCRLWMDTSAARHSKDVVGGPVLGYHPTRLAAWLRRTSGVPSPFGGDPVSHILGFVRDEPDLDRETTWYMEPVDHLASRFAGRAAASAASMSGAWLIDLRGDRLAYDDQLTRLADIPTRKLPPLVPSASVLGPVSADVVTRLGLSPDVQVVTGTADLHAAWVASGTLAEGRAHVAISTTSWISCAVPFKKTDPLHSIATVPGLRAGQNLIANNHEAAGASLAWLSRSVVGGSYPGLCLDAEGSPPGSNGVLFTPWLAGMRSPTDDRLARAGWHGMGLTTTRADLVRSVLEGVALQSRWLLTPVEKFAGHRFDVLRILGGGAASDLWCQIHADALGRRIERVADPMMAQLRGAALIAGQALGMIAWEDVEDLVPVDRTFIPEPHAERVYDRLADELPKLYAGQRGTFARLAAR
jgi:xylulokinase